MTLRQHHGESRGFQSQVTDGVKSWKPVDGRRVSQFFRNILPAHNWELDIITPPTTSNDLKLVRNSAIGQKVSDSMAESRNSIRRCGCSVVSISRRIVVLDKQMPGLKHGRSPPFVRSMCQAKSPRVPSNIIYKLSLLAVAWLWGVNWIILDDSSLRWLVALCHFNSIATSSSTIHSSMPPLKRTVSIAVEAGDPEPSAEHHSLSRRNTSYESTAEESSTKRSRSSMKDLYNPAGSLPGKHQEPRFLDPLSCPAHKRSSVHQWERVSILVYHQTGYLLQLHSHIKNI